MKIPYLLTSRGLGRGGEEDIEKEFASSYSIYDISLSIFCPFPEAENIETFAFFWCLADLKREYLKLKEWEKKPPNPTNK